MVLYFHTIRYDINVKTQTFYMCVYTLSRFICVRLFATLCTVVHQSPLSMDFSRQEYHSGLLCPLSGDLPDQGSNLSLLQLLHCRYILYH